MSTTTSSASTAPKPVEPANKPARQEGARAQGDKPAETDLFASLLGLWSDSQTPTAAPLQTDATLDADGSAANGTTDNPLAALLAWTQPGATGNGKDRSADTKGAATGADSHTTGIDKALKDSGVDISGMTRVDEPAPAATAAALARAANASRPAFSPLNPGQGAATARAADASTAATASGAAAAPTNLLWQRGAPAGTDALQQNLAASQTVRSTVALDERFGLSAGGNPNDNGTAPALREFGAGPASALGGSTATPGTTVAGAAAAGDSGSGSGSSDSRQDSQTEASSTDTGHAADASAADTEAHTISHWGTQHLRHASLRVGGEGGADNAIDIQLSVKGQEVQVAFQTDNAEARASLRENAGASLSDLMQRSGIQLGSVSVGGQSGQGSGDAATHGRAAGNGVGRTEGVGRSSGATETLSSRPAVVPPRADGSRPLDVFA
ncbi:flagellar hook-length control protein FliK [Hydrogenophaga palleronii]|uniref:flagellar hook-length control protein FliK n=1 Tax=Hydrogenophaga palleronii TaxID=65655 RepID=UPI0008245811|nr:flagellar hook-length control protein FliK [Hydrogenophaga palleronii]